MELADTLERFHLAADEFARGNPDPIKELCSRRDDVLLANPFGPAVVGWPKVSAALDYASSRFHDGEGVTFERVATYETPDQVTIHEVETWRMAVGERTEVVPLVLRVTSTYRREDGAWRLAARHADPIATHDVDGPMRRI